MIIENKSKVYDIDLKEQTICGERSRKTMDEFDILLNEQLKDKEFRKEYDAMKPEFVTIQAMIDAGKIFTVINMEQEET